MAASKVCALLNAGKIQIEAITCRIDADMCTKCGVCKRVCPTQATQMYEKKGGDVTESRCMLCARCVEMCPYEDALSLKFAGKTVMKSRNWHRIIS